MADIKQYVNLDPSNPAQLDGLDKARAGKRVVFEAKINKKIAGVPVRFEITRGGENLFEPGAVLRRVATTDADGKAVMPFDLTEHGGDEFFVKAILSEGRTNKPLTSDRYIVWRRIYYQMSRFKAGTPGAGQERGSLPEVPAFDIAAVMAELEARNHNIELVDKSGKELIKRYANLLTGKNSSLDYKLAAEDGYDAALEPVTVRIIIANKIGETRTQSCKEEDIERTDKVSVDTPENLFDDPSCAKDQDWFVSAEWRFHGADAFQPLDVKWVTRTGVQTVEINFAGAVVVAAEDAARKIDVKLTYRCSPECTNGSSWHNVVYLASKTGDGTDRSAIEMSDTATHEVGHFLNMVPTNQATHYTAHGHQGRHCFTGLAENQVDLPDYAGRPGTCIMFGESGLRRRSVFCSDCDPSLRKSTAQRAGMPKKRSDW